MERLPVGIEVQAAEHLAVGAALQVELERLFPLADRDAPQAVGAHQPEPLRVESQALQIGFTVVLASGQAEVGQLQPFGMAAAAVALGAQATEVAVLIARQPQPVVAARQTREVVAQLLDVVVVGIAQLQPGMAGNRP